MGGASKPSTSSAYSSFCECVYGPRIIVFPRARSQAGRRVQQGVRRRAIVGALERAEEAGARVVQRAVGCG